MTGYVDIEKATLKQLSWVAANMRQIDYDEITAVYPAETAVIAYILHHTSPEHCYVAFHNNTPTACFGLADTYPGMKSGWAFGTKHMPKVMRTVTRYMLRTVKPKLLEDGVRRVEVRSSINHHESHAWLELLGFKSEGIVKDYGSLNGKSIDFITYAATRQSVLLKN